MKQQIKNWFYIPSPKELEAISKYSGNDKCPKCQKGRLVLTMETCEICYGYTLRCNWNPDCDFTLDVTDLDKC